MSGQSLLERVAGNRMLLADTRIRLRSALRAVAEGRVRMLRIRDELQQAVESLAAARERIRTDRETWLATVPTPRRGGRPVPAEDDLDRVRARLHEAYAATRDAAIRAELMASYDGFARSLALKFGHREPVDDLIQVARIGLLHAIDRFDPALGRPFPLFARITITGELKRYIRDKTWGMRVPRSLQEDYLTVMRAVDELTAEHSHSPSMEALAGRCGMSIERVVEALELRVTQRALSIDAPVDAGSEQPLIDLGQEDAGFTQLENRQLLTQLLDRLPERDRRIIELRFVHEMTQAEIAAQIGVSQMCISRVLARTLGRLRLWARAAVA